MIRQVRNDQKHPKIQPPHWSISIQVNKGAPVWLNVVSTFASIERVNPEWHIPCMHGLHNRITTRSLTIHSKQSHIY